MFEQHHEPLLPKNAFVLRLIGHALVALAIIVGSLAMGVLGYHFFGGLAWLDALENASMLLGGMGPVAEMHTVAGKLFASFYALFAGLIFLVLAGVLLAPVLHRFLHHFHLEMEEEDQSSNEG